MQKKPVSYCEVNLKNLKYNYKSIIKNTSLNFFPVIKTDAYGVGVKEVASLLYKEGNKFFCVGSLEEAVQIEESGIKSQIIILNPILHSELRECIRRGYVFPVWEKSQIKDIERISGREKKKAMVQVEIDTGMGRCGVPIEKAYMLVDQLLKSNYIEKFGIFTHFSKAEEDKSFTEDQIGKFINFINSHFTKNNGFFKFIHASNSASFLKLRDKVLSFPFNSFRLGILLYGVMPYKGMKKTLNLKPVVRIKSRLIKVETLKRGAYIGYGAKLRLRKNTRIGVVSFGYCKGIHRNAWEKGYFIVNKKRVKILGTISMDLSVVDLNSVPEAKPGDDVIIVGKNGGEEITFEELSEWSDSIPHEVFVKLTGSLPKVYKK